MHKVGPTKLSHLLTKSGISDVSVGSRKSSSFLTLPSNIYSGPFRLLLFTPVRSRSGKFWVLINSRRCSCHETFGRCSSELNPGSWPQVCWPQWIDVAERQWGQTAQPAVRFLKERMKKKKQSGGFYKIWFKKKKKSDLLPHQRVQRCHFVPSSFFFLTTHL